VPEVDHAHVEAVERWRAEREARLRQPIGWLSLAGLAWLAEGDNRVGTASTNEVVLPKGPPVAGRIRVEDGRATAFGDPAAELRHEGAAPHGLTLTSDVDAPNDEGPTLLEVGPLRLCVIRRAGRLAVRTWDMEADALRTFAGVDHWPIDPAWRFTARFEPADPPRRVAVPDVLGHVEDEESPGDVAFEAGGAMHRLQALPGGPDGELWLVFGDATNGRETYAGGRFLYTPPPDADGMVEVDFNRAYNPPCVFSPYATCPLPWPENRLSLRVEAGELAYHA
jgi:uncharacterized protein